MNQNEILEILKINHHLWYSALSISKTLDAPVDKCSVKLKKLQKYGFIETTKCVTLLGKRKVLVNYYRYAIKL